MKDILNNFDYELPQELIAHSPTEPRDHSKLLVFDKQRGKISHYHFYNLVDLLTLNDVLVFNDTKVFPARLYGQKENSTKVEVLLIRQLNSNTFSAIGKPNLKPPQTIIFSDSLSGKINSKHEDGTFDIEFNQSSQILIQEIDNLGNTPLPPYISSPLTENQARSRYQTVYAKQNGSAAAPTAGLHFTEDLLTKLKQKGVQIEFVTLHVGLGTFQNLRPEQLEIKELHEEHYTLTKTTADSLNQAKKEGKNIIAVGTTTTRVLESATDNHGQLIPQVSTTKIFIQPSYKFKFVDNLITNFHLPKSSLLMLISAFTSSPNTKSKFHNFLKSPIGKAYQEAITNSYHFFSFGDSMYIKK